MILYVTEILRIKVFIYFAYSFSDANTEDLTVIIIVISFRGPELKIVLRLD